MTPPRRLLINFSVMCKVCWRKESDLVGPLAEVPTPAPVDEEYVPRPCRLHPERVTEYPYVGDLPAALRDAIYGWEIKLGIESAYEADLSVATGTKLGGCVHWIQGNSTPTCEYGHAMDHLLTIAGEEFGGNWPRWYPIEDVQATGLSREELESNYQYLYALRDVDRSNGIMLGDAGSLFLFICHQCPNWPIDYHVQMC